jgi:hypothetical protein
MRFNHLNIITASITISSLQKFVDIYDFTGNDSPNPYAPFENMKQEKARENDRCLWTAPVLITPGRVSIQALLEAPPPSRDLRTDFQALPKSQYYRTFHVDCLADAGPGDNSIPLAEGIPPLFRLASQSTEGVSKLMNRHKG